MFDKLYVSPQSYPTYVDRHVDVHEHRAPTDASVKLLREMQDAAQKATDEVIVVSNNKFECVIHRIKSYVDDRVVMRAVFLLNGRRMNAEYSCYSMIATQEMLMRGIRDAIALEIANVCLADILMVSKPDVAGRL
jgi:hypothetical protein